MHLVDGSLAGSAVGLGLLGAGTAAAAAGTALGLRRIDYERLPQVAMLSSAFFVASLVQVPVGVTSVHLLLNGLVGVILGWAAFPAILVALVLQFVFFGIGGFTTLGLNTLTMALPAVVGYYLFAGAVRCSNEKAVFSAGFAAGAMGIVLGVLLLAAELLAMGKDFQHVAELVVAVHLPVALVEGLVTGSTVVFLRKVRPALFEIPCEVVVTPLASSPMELS